MAPPRAQKGKAPKPEHHRKSPVGRVSGMGTGASKNLRELSEKAAAAALKGRIGKSGEPVLFGDINERSFVLNRARWREGDELPFPRKKLRFQVGRRRRAWCSAFAAAERIRGACASVRVCRGRGTWGCSIRCMCADHAAVSRRRSS